MKKQHLKIIVIVGVIIILVFGYLIVHMILEKNKNQPQQEQITDNPVETVYNTDDYIISQNINVYADSSTTLGENSRILAKLESVEQENDEVIGFNVVDMEGNNYEISVGDMNLISLEYNGVDEVNLVFRTGGSARLILGSYLYLYKTEDNSWSLDERVQFGGDIEKLTGTIVDFEFTSMTQQNGHILVKYIVLDDGSGQRVELPLSAMNTQSIVSDGELTVYYVGDIENNNIYNVRESDNFSVDVTMLDGSTMNFAKGSKLNLQRSSKKGYWELEKNIDSTQYKANIVDIIFDYDDDNVTGINYIVLSLENGTQEKITLLQTQAVYGKPFGNYQRTYGYNGTAMAISDVDPAPDFRIELYYQNGIELTLRIGSEVYISKSNDDIFILDYEYTHFIAES